MVVMMIKINNFRKMKIIIIVIKRVQYHTNAKIIFVPSCTAWFAKDTHERGGGVHHTATEVFRESLAEKPNRISTIKNESDVIREMYIVTTLLV